jgi:HK97 gp10 family phage protein
VRPAVEIRGLDALRKRFAALGAVKDLGPALRAEAEAVAEAARETLRERGPQSQLARSIKIMELAGGDQPAFAVGTDDPAGFFLEFGTARRRAFPWLVPVLHGRLPAVNHAVRKVIAAALKASAKV